MITDIKQRIIEKAAELFPRIGFSKVTVDDLCVELGISKKTFYRYFESKDELADAVYKWNILSVKNKLIEIIHSHNDYLERLYKLCEFISQFLSRMSKSAQKDLIKYRPDIWRKIELYRKQEVFPVFRSLLDEGIKLGIIRKDISKEIILFVLTSSVEGILTPEVLINEPFSAADAFNNIMDVLFNGVLTNRAKLKYRVKVNNKLLKNDKELE